MIRKHHNDGDDKHIDSHNEQILAFLYAIDGLVADISSTPPIPLLSLDTTFLHFHQQPRKSKNLRETFSFLLDIVDAWLQLLSEFFWSNNQQKHFIFVHI